MTAITISKAQIDKIIMDAFNEGLKTASVIASELPGLLKSNVDGSNLSQEQRTIFLETTDQVARMISDAILGAQRS